MSERESPPQKKDVARALLLRSSLFVYLDPRRSAVQVPAWLAKQPQLVLQIGLDLPVPIPDLRVDDHGVFGTLSFNRAPFACSVPWTAVFALVGEDGMGMVWPEDIPPEVAAQSGSPGAETAAKGASPLAGKSTRSTGKPSPLRAIEGGASDAETNEVSRSSEMSAPDDATSTDEGRRKLPPYLRVIK